MLLKNRLKTFFYNRAPNSLLFDHIRVHFPNEDPEVIQQTLDELVLEGFLKAQEHINQRYPNLCRKSWHISAEHLGSYPIQTEIDLGNIKIPRMLDGDAARGEDINSIAFSVNKIVDQKIREIKELYDNEVKRLWSTIVTIFGLFLAVFSLVNAAIKPVYFSSELRLPPQEILIQSMCNLLPLSAVLVIFVVALWLIFRR